MKKVDLKYLVEQYNGMQECIMVRKLIYQKKEELKNNKLSQKAIKKLNKELDMLIIAYDSLDKKFYKNVLIDGEIERKPNFCCLIKDIPELLQQLERSDEFKKSKYVLNLEK